MRKMLLVGAALLLGLQAAGAYDYGQNNVTFFDCSATLTANTAKTILQGKSVHGFQLKNEDNTEQLCFSLAGAASCGAAGTYSLQQGSSTVQGGSYKSDVGPNNAVSVIAATNGHIVSCTYW